MKLINKFSPLLLIIFIITNVRADSFQFKPGLFTGLGSMSVEQVSSKEGDTWTNGIYVLPAYQLFSLLSVNFKLGVYGEYAKTFQRTDVQDLGGTNFEGTGYYYGPGLIFNILLLDFALIYPVGAKYSYKSNTQGGEEISLSDPEGFNIMLSFPYFMVFTIDLSYLNIKYKDKSYGATTFSITDNKIIRQEYRLGISFNF